MILVDTNVISEPLRKAPEARVVEWIDAQPLETLYLSAITVAELRFGGSARDQPHRTPQPLKRPIMRASAMAAFAIIWVASDAGVAGGNVSGFFSAYTWKR
jgi:predicted nucleic acid-binding protein